MFTEVSPSSVSLSPEVCSREAGVSESVLVSSSVSSSVRPKVCSRTANSSHSVVVEPVEVSVSPESVASTIANVVGEKVEKMEASVAVEVVELICKWRRNVEGVLRMRKSVIASCGRRK